MCNVWLVAAREYRERVKSPAFIISSIVLLITTLAMPIIMLVATGSVMTKVKHVAFYDATGQVGADFVKLMDKDDLVAKTGVTRWQIEPIAKEQVAAYEAKAHAGDVFGVLLVTGSFPRDLHLTFEGSGATNVAEAGVLATAISRRAHQAVAQAAGLDRATAEFLTGSLPLDRVDLSAGGKQDEQGAMLRFSLGMMVMMLVYITVLGSGSLLFQGVLEEKTSRVVELMAAAVRPTQMMAGKIVGLGLLNLTQLGAVILAFLAFAVQTGALAISSLLVVALYGILGYFMYAALFAAAGAMVSRLEDGASVMMPIILPIMLPVALSQVILSHPDSTTAVVFSLIPLFTPTVMAQRMILTQPPLWQVLTSMALLAGTITLFTWLAGRVYRVGILTYGNRPTLKQLWTYLRA